MPSTSGRSALAGRQGRPGRSPEDSVRQILSEFGHGLSVGPEKLIPPPDGQRAETWKQSVREQPALDLGIPAHVDFMTAVARKSIDCHRMFWLLDKS